VSEHPRKVTHNRATVIHRRRIIERLWVVGVVAWGLGRTVIVWETLGGYGVNPWVYGAIDVVSSVPYGLATARVVENLIDRDRVTALRWGVVAAVTFVLPDLYIVIAGRHMPVVVYVVLALLVVLLGTLAARGVVNKARAHHRHHLAELAAELTADQV